MGPDTIDKPQEKPTARAPEAPVVDLANPNDRLRLPTEKAPKPQVIENGQLVCSDNGLYPDARKSGSDRKSKGGSSDSSSDSSNDTGDTKDTTDKEFGTGTEKDTTRKLKDGTSEPGKDSGNPAGSDGKPETEKEATDRIKREKAVKAVSDFSSTLQKAGYTEEEASTFAQQTYNNFAKQEAKDVQDKLENKNVQEGPEWVGHLRGTATDQINRMNVAANDILDMKGVTTDRDGQRRLKDGQIDHMTDEDRKGMVRDMGSRYADPKKNGVQGEHYTCALESQGKQHEEAGDPAAGCEAVASLANTGGATITDRKGNPRTVHIDSLNLKHDAESSLTFNKDFGSQDIRGMYGQAYDALAGQVMADLKAERLGGTSSAKGIDHADLKYMTAHADEVNPKSGLKTKTGEGLFVKGADGYHIAKQLGPDNKYHNIDHPDAQIWDVAATNYAMGGARGAVFAHSNFVNGDRPPKGFDQDLRITTFGSNEEAVGKLKDFEARTGQSAQLLVNATHLPDGGKKGHALHCENMSLNADGKSFDLDNNWSINADKKQVSWDALQTATDPKHWNPGNGNLPDYLTPIGPGGTEQNAPALGDREAEAKRRHEHELEEERKHKEEKERERARLEAEKHKKEEEELAAATEKQTQKQAQEQAKQQSAEQDRQQQLDLDRALTMSIYGSPVVSMAA